MTLRGFGLILALSLVALTFPQAKVSGGKRDGGGGVKSVRDWVEPSRGSQARSGGGSSRASGGSSRSSGGGSARSSGGGSSRSSGGGTVIGGGSSSGGGTARSSGGGSRSVGDGRSSGGGTARSSGGGSRSVGDGRSSGGGTARSSGGGSRSIGDGRSSGGGTTRSSGGGSRSIGDGRSSGGGTVIGGGRSSGSGAVAGGRYDGRSGSSGYRSGGGGSRSSDDAVQGRAGNRPGTVRYGGGSSNRSDGRGGVRISIGRPPADILVPGNSRLKRHPGHNNRRDYDWRVGYWHYNRQWRDDYWGFSHYIFDPFRYDCVVSPWYYYHSLPPYFSNRRVTIVSVLPPLVIGQDPYSYPDPYRRNDSRELDRALDDIRDMFLDEDRRALEDLLPRRGVVNIYVDGRYSYSIDPDDFYDSTRDAIENVRTRDYEIVRVRRSGGYVHVTARHEFEDPWGGREAVYHTYRLEPEGDRYVIREFGTTNSDRY